MKASLLTGKEREEAAKAFLNLAEKIMAELPGFQRNALVPVLAFNPHEAAELSERLRKRLGRFLALQNEASGAVPMSATEAGNLLGYTASGFKRVATQKGIEARPVAGHAEKMYLRRDVWKVGGLLRREPEANGHSGERMRAALSRVRASGRSESGK